jgi:hypothetical protein
MERASKVYTNQPEFLVPWCLALYRNGQFSEAIQRLEETLRTSAAKSEPDRVTAAWLYTLLTVAYARSGHGGQAAQFWQKAKPAIQVLLRKQTRGVPEAGWRTRQEFEVLSSEATQLVEGNSLSR